MKRMNKVKWRKPMFLRALCFRFKANNNYISASTFIKSFLYSKCCVKSSTYIIPFNHYESRRKASTSIFPMVKRNLGSKIPK